MTVTGSSAQYDEIRSTGAAGSSASSSSCAIASARARSCSTARTVKTRLTSLRYRVWSGATVAAGIKRGRGQPIGGHGFLLRRQCSSGCLPLVRYVGVPRERQTVAKSRAGARAAPS